MNACRVLIVDDEESVCWTLERALTQDGFEVQTAATAEDALARLRQWAPDIVLLDVRLPGMDGLEALTRFRQTAPDVPVIIMTAFGRLTVAVDAVARGAFDYLAKPFDLEAALATISSARRQRALRTAADLPDADRAPRADELLGASAAMQEVFKRIALAAQCDASVMIRGESGVGKELVARAIHRFSARRDAPFLPVHIASLNPNLIESELFGHVKGAFTGALEQRQGLFALADRGTIFLDEIAEVPLPVQVKLLRLLEQKEVLPVGASQTQKFNVRLLAATHQDLQARLTDSSFRHDLFFRLNTFEIVVPPLRERPEDIRLLAQQFIRRLAPAGAVAIPEETLRFLTSLPWHGNVRELHHALEHATILARGGPLLPEHLPKLASFPGPPAPPSTDEALIAAVRAWFVEQIPAPPAIPTDLLAALLQRVEPVLLDEVLKRVQGNRWTAARWLGLNRATVRKKLAAYGLTQAHLPAGRRPEGN